MDIAVRTKTPAQSDKILGVAARLFATHRFHEARLEDIATEAGVGKGTIYRYFKDKEDLYLALLNQAACEFSERVREAYNRSNCPEQQIRDLVEALVSYFDEQPYVFDLIQHTEVLGPSDGDNPWNETRKEMLSLFHQALVDGQKAGVFDMPDPVLSVLLLLGSIRAVIRFGVRPRPVDLGHQITERFFFGHRGTGCSGNSYEPTR
jgi:TetR/AcrR family fatty acid metabolism transcriptional regulator